jgi:hypothetical protein
MGRFIVGNLKICLEIVLLQNAERNFRNVWAVLRTRPQLQKMMFISCISAIVIVVWLSQAMASWWISENYLQAMDEWLQCIRFDFARHTAYGITWTDTIGSYKDGKSCPAFPEGVKLFELQLLKGIFEALLPGMVAMTFSWRLVNDALQAWRVARAKAGGKSTTAVAPLNFDSRAYDRESECSPSQKTTRKTSMDIRGAVAVSTEAGPESRSRPSSSESGGRSARSTARHVVDQVLEETILNTRNFDPSGPSAAMSEVSAAPVAGAEASSEAIDVGPSPHDSETTVLEQEACGALKVAHEIQREECSRTKKEVTERSHTNVNGSDVEASSPAVVSEMGASVHETEASSDRKAAAAQLCHACHGEVPPGNRFVECTKCAGIIFCATCHEAGLTHHNRSHKLRWGIVESTELSTVSAGEHDRPTTASIPVAALLSFHCAGCKKALEPGGLVQLCHTCPVDFDFCLPCHARHRQTGKPNHDKDHLFVTYKLEDYQAVPLVAGSELTVAQDRSKVMRLASFDRDLSSINTAAFENMGFPSSRSLDIPSLSNSRNLNNPKAENLAADSLVVKEAAAETVQTHARAYLCHVRLKQSHSAAAHGPGENLTSLKNTEEAMGLDTNDLVRGATQPVGLQSSDFPITGEIHPVLCIDINQ